MDTKLGLLLGIVVTCLVFVNCRDFYTGMFKKGDILAVNDFLYKERRPFTRAVAKYLKVLRCPITYIRVADRLGLGSGPNVRIIRGGLKKNHIYLYLTSSYNRPLSVAIYLGCPRAKTKHTKRIQKTTSKPSHVSKKGKKTTPRGASKKPSTTQKSKVSENPSSTQKPRTTGTLNTTLKSESTKTQGSTQKSEVHENSNSTQKPETTESLNNSSKPEATEETTTAGTLDTTSTTETTAALNFTGVPETTTPVDITNAEDVVQNRIHEYNIENEVVNDEPNGNDELKVNDERKNDEPQNDELQNDEPQKDEPHLPKRPSSQDSALNFKHMV